MNKKRGISQIAVMVIMLVLAIALPITTNLVKKSQENRSKAVDNGSTCTPNGGASESGVINNQWSCFSNSNDNLQYYYYTYDKLDVSRSEPYKSNTFSTYDECKRELDQVLNYEPASSDCYSEEIPGSTNNTLTDCEQKGGTCVNNDCCVPSVNNFSLGTCTSVNGHCVTTSGLFNSGETCTTGGITNVRYSCTGANEICCVPATTGIKGTCASVNGTCLDVVQNVGKYESGRTCTPRSGSYYGGTNNGTTDTSYSCSKASEICCIENESINKCSAYDCANTCDTKEHCENVGCLWAVTATDGSSSCVPSSSNYCHKGYCSVCKYETDCNSHQCIWNNSTNTCSECVPDCSCAKDTLVGSQCSDGCGYACNGTKVNNTAPTSTPAPTTIPTNPISTPAPTTIPTNPISTPTPTNVCISGNQKCTATNRYFTCNSGQWSTTTTNCPTGQVCTTDAVGTNVCRETDYTAPSLNLFFAISGVKAVNPCFGDLGFKVNVAKDGQDGITGNVTATVVANKFNQLGDQVFKISNFALDNTYSLTDKVKIFISGKKTLATLYGKNSQTSGFGALNTSQILVSSLGDNAVLDFSAYPVLNGDVGKEGQLGAQDGVVNAVDFSYMKNQWGNTCNSGQNLEADLNGDCRVDTFDLQILKNAMAEQYAQKTF